MLSAPGTSTTIDGRSYLYFGGTGYLGLQCHPQVIEAACEATRRWGVGSATNRGGWGTTPPVQEVEHRAAQFWQCDDAYYFASGYSCNHILLSAIHRSVDMLFVDEFAHFSIEDACRFFRLPIVRFRHRDAMALSESLGEHLPPGAVPLVFSDGVFASRGSLAPVQQYLEVLQVYDHAALCLDDCHAVGVLGTRGWGTYEHFGLDTAQVNDLPLSSAAPRLFATGTLSKAFGGHGGIVYGSTRFIHAARDGSDYFRGASAPATPAAAASAMGLQLVTENPEIVYRLQRNAKYLRAGLRSLGLEVDSSPVPFVGITLGDGANMARLQQSLASDQILVAHSRCYSGLDADGALRIAVFATHTTEMIDQLLTALAKHL
ncbi:aminotransferase class I/II-fold pyridoxal phosphate-dependent enzyme [Aeoliella mucimassa]|nr:pyridoxal phosphate-dependent aminotransferase family protein [Aeoliella mucimassa]